MQWPAAKQLRRKRTGGQRPIYCAGTGPTGRRRRSCLSAFPGGNLKELPMAFRPNYRFDRIERDRLKKAKKEEKLRRQQERKSEEAAPDAATAGEPAPPEA